MSFRAVYIFERTFGPYKYEKKGRKRREVRRATNLLASYSYINKKTFR